MNIHEYQAKAIFYDSGVKVVKGLHCTNLNEALQAYDELESTIVAVKSQIHAGGRGKGVLYDPNTNEKIMEGGVKIAFSREEVRKYASSIIGNKLVTNKQEKKEK